MTDIAVYTTSVQAENLSWDLSNPGVAYVESGTLDLTAFNAGQHYPNGYIPSGTVLGKITASGKLGPYLDTAVDGRTTAVGYLQASVPVTLPNGTVKTVSGCAVLRAFGVVSVAKLPFTSGTAALGGYIDANGQTDLAKIFHAA